MLIFIPVGFHIRQNKVAIANVTLVNCNRHTRCLPITRVKFGTLMASCSGSSLLLLNLQHRSNLITRLGKLYLQPFFCLTRFELAVT